MGRERRTLVLAHGDDRDAERAHARHVQGVVLEGGEALVEVQERGNDKKDPDEPDPHRIFGAHRRPVVGAHRRLEVHSLEISAEEQPEREGDGDRCDSITDARVRRKDVIRELVGRQRALLPRGAEHHRNPPRADGARLSRVPPSGRRSATRPPSLAGPRGAAAWPAPCRRGVCSP